MITMPEDLAVGDLVRLDHRTTYRLADHGFDLVKRSEERKLIADAAEYLKAIFKDSDWLAVLLIDQREGVKQPTQQRIAAAHEIVRPEFQSWLKEQNQRGYNVYVGMNALKPEAHGRTKEDVGQIRTLYVDIDAGGRDKVRAILNAAETPRPDWILNTSLGKVPGYLEGARNRAESGGRKTARACTTLRHGPGRDG